MRPIEEILKNKRLEIISKPQVEGQINLVGFIHYPLTNRPMLFVFSQAMGWEHLSVSHKNKIPTWEEMAFAKEQFWQDEECCVEYHPKKSQYKNLCETCLHIWKQVDKEFPTPPIELV